MDHNIRDILRCDDLSGEDIAGCQQSNRATRLSVVIGEEHPFLGELIEVRSPPSHDAAMVGANVPHPDVIAHDEDDVAVGYAKFRSRSHDTVIGIYDDAGNRIQRHESHRRLRLRFFGNFASQFP